MPCAIWRISQPPLASLAEMIMRRRASLAGAVQATVLGYSAAQLMQACRAVC